MLILNENTDIFRNLLEKHNNKQIPINKNIKRFLMLSVISTFKTSR